MPRKYRIIACPHCGNPCSEKTMRCRSCAARARGNGRTPVPLAERFQSRIENADDPDACWPWTGHLQKNGYGVIDRGKRAEGKVYAHRLSWEIAMGPIPDGMEVCHNCPSGDNPACVNPSHLFLGTHADNMRDARTKDRLNLDGLAEGRRGGEGHPTSKLTRAAVQEIRQRHRAGESGSVLAIEYGVSPSTICDIMAERTWPAHAETLSD